MFLNINDKTNNSIHTYTIIQPIKSNKEFFTVNEIEGVHTSRDYQEFILFQVHSHANDTSETTQSTITK